MSAPLLDSDEPQPPQSRLPHLMATSLPNRLPLISSSVIFLLTLILYLTTLAPSVVTLFDDSLEFQLVTYQLGIAHPTGYPLYTLLGKLFTLLPVGNVAYRINVMSAVFGAATVALLYLGVFQMMWRSGSSPRRGPNLPAHLGGITGAFSLAFSPVFWQQATIAEVYTLNAFFVALLLLISLWPLTGEQQRTRILWLAFFVGLSLTHHRTMLLLIPALGLYLFLSQGQQLFEWRTILLSLALVTLPLLLYLYLPLRGHIGSLDGTYQDTWAGFWRQISGGGYGTFIFENPFGHDRDAAFYGRLFSGQFFSLIPGLVGLVYLLRNRRLLLGLTLCAFLTYLLFNISYQVTDIEVFFIPNFLIWAIWSGVGVAWLLQIILDLKAPLWRWGLGGALTLGLTLGLVWHFQHHRALVTEAYTWQVHDYGLDMLRQPLPQNRSVIIGIVGEMTLLRYFQQTEGIRPDVETVAADREPERLATVEQSLAEGKSVYLTRDLPGAARQWSLGAVGPLIRVNPQPLTGKSALNSGPIAEATDEISLVGYEVSRPPHTGGGLAPVRLTLFWEATEPIPTDLKVSARLLNAEGEAVATTDGVPVHFAYPTTAWRPGEIVADVYDLRLPPETDAGTYRPVVIWYDPANQAAEVGRIELERVVVE